MNEDVADLNKMIERLRDGSWSNETTLIHLIEMVRHMRELIGNFMEKQP